MRSARAFLWVFLCAAGAAAAGFTPTGSLAVARVMATATLLPDGQVLIVGGLSDSSAELYDPKKGTFSRTGSAHTRARNQATATLLRNGKVLIAGGCAGGPKPPVHTYGVATASAEIYDPETGTFAGTGSLRKARYWATATLLADGKVLIAGGNTESQLTIPSAELYDPASGRFSSTGPMAKDRDQATATLLPDGQVLIAGGHSVEHGPLPTAELYDPRTGRFTLTGSMSSERWGATATLLPNGKVLIAGGNGIPSGLIARAELYDPATGQFIPTGSLATAREYATATLLPNGQVLIVGGIGLHGWLSSAELYDPATGSFSPAGSLTSARHKATATLLPNGKVLIAGGWVPHTDGTTAELYEPGATVASAPPAPSTQPARPAEPATGAFWEAASVSDVFRLFRQKLTGQRMALEFNLDKHGARLLVQDPRVPENVDRYTYRDGRVVGPEPEHWDAESGERPFDWSAVAAVVEKAIPSSVGQALVRLHLEGAVPSLVQIRWLATDPQPRLRIYVDGARKNGWVDLDTSGKVIRSEIY